MLHRLRRAAKVTLKDIGEACDLSVPHLSSIESGTRRPPCARKVRQMAERIGCDPAPLIEASLLGSDTIELDIRDPRVRQKAILLAAGKE